MDLEYDKIINENDINTLQSTYSSLAELFNDESKRNSTSKFMFGTHKFLKNGFKLESYYTPAYKLATFMAYDPNNKLVETVAIPGCRHIKILWDLFLEEYDKVRDMDLEYDKTTNENNDLDNKKYSNNPITLEMVLNWFFEDVKEMESKEELEQFTKFYAKYIIPRFLHTT